MSRHFIEIRSLSDWQSRLGDPELHWRRGASAMELAISWTLAKESARGMPVPVAELLDSCADLAGANVEFAIPELRTNLPGGSAASQTDLWAFLRSSRATIALAVEGKALEPFGETVDRWLGNARPERAPSAGRVKRINFLAERLGLDPASIGDLRYQLLHRTVAALIEAERWKTSAAVMLVQRFSRRPTEQAASWTDFHNFALRLKADAQPNAFIRAEVPTEIPLYLAWLDCDVATDAEILAAALDRPLREAAPRRNAFEALCALASRESWCWRLGCTTCGCMHFRYGLMEMARGGHPDSPNWITRSRVRSTRLSERLGEMPGIPMPANVQKQVIAIASQSNLAKISSVSKFPDWLGYLGVILHFCSDAEAASRALTASWATQLCRLLPAESQLEHRLTDLTEAGRVLSLADLESVESELLHSHVHV